jgi:hypothetical protein
MNQFQARQRIQLKKKLLVGGLLLMMPSLSFAQEMAVYPKKGQSSQQQEKDTTACYNWAKKQTGFDPASSANVPPSQYQQPGGAVRGAGRGAAAGAVGGAIAGDAGKGAAVGAGVGALGGATRRRQAEQQAVQQQQQAQAAQNQLLTSFKKAEAACLEGRGYSVK